MNHMPRLSPQEEQDMQVLRDIINTGDDVAHAYWMGLPADYRAYLLKVSRIELGVASIADVTSA